MRKRNREPTFFESKHQPIEAKQERFLTKTRTKLVLIAIIIYICTNKNEALMLNNMHLGTFAKENAQRFGEKIAYYYQDKDTENWLPITWKEINERVVKMAYALLAYGIKPGDKVGIFSQNMVEIIVVDLALHSIRGAAVPMYATQSADQIKYIANDATISLIFVGEQYQFDETAKVLQGETPLRKVVCIDPEIDSKGLAQAVRYSDFINSGDNKSELKAEYDKRQSELSYDDTAILIYTSGTTGEPKGVELTYDNARCSMNNHVARWGEFLTKGYTSMSFLPMSHIFERGMIYICMLCQMPVYVNVHPKEIQKTLKQVHPNCMCAVPRFWEKVYSGVYERLDSFPSWLRKWAFHALEVGKEYHMGHRRVGKEPSLWLKLRYNFYDKTFFHALRKVVGLDKGKLFPVAGSACSEKVIEFMRSVGINFMVGYGLTETFATVTCSNIDNKNYRMDTAGEVIDNMEVKIDPTNNEILLKSPTITKGYYNKPEENKKAFTEDGFFRTGDAGKLVQGARYQELVIIERIKELFKTSNGKYIAPQQLEMLLEGDKYIDQSCVIANDRKYVTALLIPDYKQVEAYAQENGIAYSSREEMLASEKVQALFKEHVATAMAPLAAYEQVKYFTLLPHGFSLEKGELTNTLKMKRKVINEHYANEIEAMYKH